MPDNDLQISIDSSSDFVKVAVQNNSMWRRPPRRNLAGCDTYSHHETHCIQQAIQSALPNPPVTESISSTSAEPASIVVPLSRLKKLLASDDGEAADFILDAQPQLAKVLTGSEITALSSFVGNFDFSGALKCVSEIAARLSIQLG